MNREPKLWNKVFGIGLSKTGTTSLAIALKLLGLKVEDFPHDARTHEQLEAGDYNLDVLKEMDAITDTPAAVCYQQLDHQFPNSKFVLTERQDREEWLKSAKNHWSFTERWVRHYPEQERFVYFINVAMFGLNKFNRNRFIEVYDRHAREARHYFRQRPNDLLILDATRDNCWELLGDFLGIRAPDAPYPNANRSEDKDKSIQWIELLDRLYAKFERFIAQGAKVVLVDDQALNKTRFYEKWECLSLTCETDVNDIKLTYDQAIANTQRHLTSGAEYIIIASFSFWWFESYPNWTAWLNECLHLIHSDETCRIYKLGDKMM